MQNYRKGADCMETAIRYVMFIFSLLLTGAWTSEAKAISTMTVTSRFLNADKQGNYERILFIGQAGEDVYRLKSALRALGYNIRDINCQYDKDAQTAVGKFQLDNGLKVDGIAGKNTLNLVYKKIAADKLSIQTPIANIRVVASKGYWITINKSSNTLTLLKGKQIVNKYNIATGKKWTLTPEGKFRIVNKLVNPEWFKVKGGIPENPLGYRWMGLSIGSGWFYGIHGNNNPRSVGTYASNGCVRMYNQDVEYLYEILNVGTPVWIGSQNQLKKWGVY